MICKRCGGDIDTRRRRPDGSLQCPKCKVVYRPRPTQPQQQSPLRKPQKRKKPVKLIVGFAVLLLLLIILIGSCGNEENDVAATAVKAKESLTTQSSVISIDEDLLGLWVCEDLTLNFDEKGYVGIYLAEDGTITSGQYIAKDNHLTIYRDNAEESELSFDYSIVGDELFWGGLILIHNGDMSQAYNTEPGITEVPTQAPTEKPSIFPQTIFNKNGVKINITGFEHLGTFGPEIKITIENTSGSDLTINTGSLHCDGWQIAEHTCYVSVANGAKAGETIYIYNSDIEECGLSRYAIDDVQFKGAYLMSSDYMNTYEFEMTATLQ